jgi:hypothetical protein
MQFADFNAIASVGAFGFGGIGVPSSPASTRFLQSRKSS